MSPILQGIQIGLLLALLVGPLIVALLQASLEQGTRAGLTVALGIWVSDLLFILTVFFGVGAVLMWVEWESFELSLGLLGALVLLATGLLTLLTPPPALTGEAVPRAHAGLWMKGFLINTINPFTVFFWVSMMTGVVLEEQWAAGEAVAFFGALLGTIVTTDTLKVLLARQIRHRLGQRQLLWIRRVSGLALLIFALVLAGRVIW